LVFRKEQIKIWSLSIYVDPKIGYVWFGYFSYPQLSDGSSFNSSLFCILSRLFTLCRSIHGYALLLFTCTYIIKTIKYPLVKTIGWSVTLCLYCFMWGSKYISNYNIFVLRPDIFGYRTEQIVYAFQMQTCNTHELFSCLPLDDAWHELDRDMKRFN